MSELSFSTTPFSVPEQFAVWKETVCEQFMSLNCESVNYKESFSGAVSMRAVDDYSICHLKADSHKVTRSADMMSRDHKSCYYINYQTAGYCTLTDHKGNQSRINPGDSFLVSSDEYFQMEFDQLFSHFVIELPHFEHELPTGKVFTSHNAEDRLINSMINNVRVESKSVSDEFLQSYLKQLQSLVHSQDFALEKVASIAGENSFLRELKKYIYLNISESDLSAESIARHFRLSRRSLYRNFETIGTTPARYIASQRIARAKMLFRNNTGSTIADVSYQVGFEDSSNFSKKFRQETGMSPKEYRNQFSE